MKNEELIRRLLNIGQRMSYEYDIENILSLIIKEVTNITEASFGSIAILEDRIDKQYLTYQYLENNKEQNIVTNDLSFEVNKETIVGSSFLNKEVYNFASLDQVKEILGFDYDRSFDEKANTFTHNLLVIPMINYRHDCEGVLVLANKRVGDQYVPFTTEDVEIAKSLTSQAATLIDRAKLFNEVDLMIDSIIETLVASLERRDPVTSGHSKRVATLSLDIANYISNRKHGPFVDYTINEDGIRELYFASMLHDIGKIGVSGSVLRKKFKLTTDQMEILRLRLQLIEVKEHLNLEANQVFAKLSSINESRFLVNEDFVYLQQLYETETLHYPILTNDEFLKLSVREGNLTIEEREHVKEHAQISYDILKNVRWSNRLSKIPEIASAHHEKLDGSGYPRKLKGNEVSIEAQIIGLADIYDALTTRDRPYKDGMNHLDAMSIIVDESKHAKINKDLVSEFIDMMTKYSRN